MDLATMTWQDVLLVLGLCAGGALIGSITLFIVAARQIADIDVPADADFFDTLRLVPITVPLALDLLDMAFDIFSAPISWIILELLGLKQLQTITLFEGLIPGTQLIPTMTIAWGVARLMGGKKRSAGRDALHEYGDSTLPSLRQLASRSNVVDQYRSRPLLSSGEDYSRDDYVDMEEFEEDYLTPPPEFFDDQQG